MLVGKPVAQNHDRLDPALPGRGSQGRSDVMRVADDITADRGLGDVGSVVGRGPGRWSRVARGPVHEALLETDLAQRRGSHPEPVDRRRRHVECGGLGGDGVEVIVGQLDQALVQPQAQHWSGVSQHLSSPVRGVRYTTKPMR